VRVSFPDHFSLIFGTFSSLFFVVVPEGQLRSNLRLIADVLPEYLLYGESVVATDVWPRRLDGRCCVLRGIGYSSLGDTAKTDFRGI
jgi:hypothetical protein